VRERDAESAAGAMALPGKAMRLVDGAYGGRQLERLPPQAWVALGLALFAGIWLTHLAHASLVPPVDDIEQLLWVRSLEWGYYKHPPLPTWLIWLPVQMFGLSAWVAYALGAVCTLGAMAMLWYLLARIRGSTHASVALLAVLCITYYNGRLYYFNHNSVLLLLSTLCAVLCWQAFSTRRLRWWLALGLALGLGALAKYQIAVTVLSLAAFLLHQRAWRDPQHRRGALLAGLVALTVFAPHIEWLHAHDFAPIRYAVESSLGARLGATERVLASLGWLLDQLFNRALPALILLAVVARSVPARPLAPHRDAARSLLLAWGVVPLLSMTLMGMAAGADLQLQWGTPFLLFAVPAVMELRPRLAWQRANVPGLVKVFIVIQGLLLVLSQLSSPLGPPALRDRHWRAFDSAQLAERIAEPARAALSGPIRVVIGATGPAGALALRLPERPPVLIDGRFDRSPWIDADLLRRCGALQLGPARSMAGAMPVGPDFPGLAWRIVPRELGAAPCPAE
jgi:4-amino-4-deoxy-L-arabinose transferase-like glycosyltransferase